MSEKRAQAILTLSAIINVVLLALKLSVGFIANSRALIADGINSALDVFFSVMILVSFRLASKPADKNHPYGHGNIEVLAAFLAAIVILGTGAFIIYDGIKSAINPELQIPGWLALATAGFSIATKFALYIYARSVMRKWKSPAVKVQAADHLSDILATSAALLGILLAQIGLRFFDPLGAVIIGAFICWTGIKLIKENHNILLDAHPAEKYLDKIKECAVKCKGVTSVPHMRAHPVGAFYFLEITITVDGKLAVREGHDIAENLKRVLLNCENSLKDVIVHVEPSSN